MSLKGRPLKFGDGIFEEVKKREIGIGLMDGSLTKEMIKSYLDEIYGKEGEESEKRPFPYTGPVKDCPGWYQIDTGRMIAYCGQGGWDMYQEALRKEAERITLQNDKV